MWSPEPDGVVAQTGIAWIADSVHKPSMGTFHYPVWHLFLINELR